MHYFSLKRHFDTAHGQLRFPCQLCGKIFTQQSSVSRHLAALHGVNPHDNTTFSTDGDEKHAE
jgi:hypothetical protein